ncbi:MAG: bifunctional folylpolyglutamate synthase/dihydrofolate synthase [Bacteroidaceae bacterium]|nr:bifunctional folylpolyglutamate synthase/dihydrofolate synthase [Bacteroidaceae bacterium]
MVKSPSDPIPSGSAVSDRNPGAELFPLQEEWDDTLSYLYNSAPLFQNIGAGAYKEGLENTRALDEHFGHPHRRYVTVHVAGTNGKGSVSSLLAAVLQSAGYKVGLYTSPHLTDFRERIRVGGEMIPKERVIRFVREEKAFFEPLHPSFFELTTALAFLYFAEQDVDVAVVEVGLGGRLDCTNIITPALSVITNISKDHTQFLGDTLPEIAAEKAGIIKQGIPVVIGEAGSDGVRRVFEETASRLSAPLFFAEQFNPDEEFAGPLPCELEGEYQEKNKQTVLCALSVLRANPFFHISEQAVRSGFANVSMLTGLRGRWQKLRENPTVICDVGHNVGGIQYVTSQLAKQKFNCLHVVYGMVNDKDARGALSLMPKSARWYFTAPSCARALPAGELAGIGESLGLQGEIYTSVADAYRAAMDAAETGDLVFVGGSCYVVADLLASLSD